MLMPDDRHAHPGPTTLGCKYPIGYLVTVGCLPMELGLEKYFPWKPATATSSSADPARSWNKAPARDPTAAHGLPGRAGVGWVRAGLGSRSAVAH